MQLKQLFFRASLLVLTLAFVGEAISQEPAVTHESNVERAIVLVESDTARGGGFFATSTGIVITALSNVVKASRVAITTSKHETYDTVTLLAFDRARNLAVLKIGTGNFPFIEIAKRIQAKSGESIYLVGYSFANNPPVLLSEKRIVSSNEGVSEISLAHFVSAGTTQNGTVLVDPEERVIGMVTQTLGPGSEQPLLVTNKDLKQILNSVDQTKPVFQWKGTDVTFRMKPLAGISGYWKSTNGNVYLVEDKGGEVKITNMSAPKFRYIASWEGELLIGLGYNDDKKRFVLSLNDADHLIRAVFKYDSKDTKELVIEKAKKEIKKPGDLWVRLR